MIPPPRTRYRIQFMAFAADGTSRPIDETVESRSPEIALFIARHRNKVSSDGWQEGTLQITEIGMVEA